MSIPEILSVGVFQSSDDWAIFNFFACWPKCRSPLELFRLCKDATYTLLEHVQKPKVEVDRSCIEPDEGSVTRTWGSSLSSLSTP